MSARDELGRAFKAAILDKSEWRSVAVAPEKDGHITIVCGPGNRSACGVYLGGQWLNERKKPLPFEPTHWLAWLDD